MDRDKKDTLKIRFKDMKNSPERLEQFANSFSKIATTMTAYHNLLHETIENIQKVANKFLSSLPIKDLSLTESMRINIRKNCDDLFSRGWVIFKNMPVDYLFEIKNEQLDKKILLCYDEQYLDTLYESLTKAVPAADLEEIKICFNTASYKACSALIIPQIEYYLVTNYKQTAGKIWKNDPDNNDFKVLVDNKKESWIYAFVYSLQKALIAIFDSHQNFLDEDNLFELPNRHYLAHGFSKRIYTKKDCLCLLSVLDGIISVKKILTPS